MFKICKLSERVHCLFLGSGSPFLVLLLELVFQMSKTDIPFCIVGIGCFVSPKNYKFSVILNKYKGFILQQSWVKLKEIVTLLLVKFKNYLSQTAK